MPTSRPSSQPALTRSASAQMASAAQELTNLSVELQTVVSRFRLG